MRNLIVSQTPTFVFLFMYFFIIILSLLTELRCKMEFCQIATRVYLKKLSFLYIGYKIKVIKTGALSLPPMYTCLTLVRTLKSRNMAKATKTDYISRENFRPQLFKTWLTLSTR